MVNTLVIKKIGQQFLHSLLLATVISVLTACSDQPDAAQASSPNHKKLLVYCGITMIKPVSDLAAIFERQENCKVMITKGGSGNLLKSILYNQKGDLYLAGSDRYFTLIEEKYPGLVTSTAEVGSNKAVMMVQKGNPKNIPASLTSLADPAYAVVIGNPDSGSVGKETKKILERKGIYASVVKNSMYMTTDSKDLVKTIKNKEADIVINWFAAFTWDNNAQFLDVIEIDPEYVDSKKLVLGRLKFSPDPDLATRFMTLVSSGQGRDVFKKYGLAFD